MNKVIIGIGVILSCAFIVNCEPSHKKVESSQAGSNQVAEVSSAAPVNSSTSGSGGEGGGK